ncbi:uncharacterized protein SPSK_03462 [Sporothrix schenckii 1099-18]|uniref:DUF1014 domain protein n=1 Tax=Sporothrix schenckii 1099-18 TaxID=1397361 RepID=A0A0F2M0F1_SPOSC|nr:uncharacterized protein SPSK_03462 [Sporothrix schenckii 1099-18]KJR82240.1 hypothetical protein SPSK_03462 [Sporothrix schenckii 1099-18]
MAGGGRKAAEASSKKAQGQARKADAVAQKAAAEEARREADEAAEWSKGAKGAGKNDMEGEQGGLGQVHETIRAVTVVMVAPDGCRCIVLFSFGYTSAPTTLEAEAAKKAELARKKAERDTMLAEEEKNTPGRAAPKNAKSATKKTTAAPSRGLDLSQLGDAAPADKKLTAVSATGIDNALDALSLDSAGAGGAGPIDRHPERRFKAAFAAFEERRLAEMDADGSSKGLRLNQRKDKIRKEFEKSPENPFNQVTARYDANKAEIAQIKDQEKAKIEKRLGA